MEKKGIKSFNTFLKTVKQSGAGPVEEADDSTRVMQSLESGAAPTSKLLKETGLGFDDLAKSLKQLEAFGLVETSTQNKLRVFELTDEGRKSIQHA